MADQTRSDVKINGDGSTPGGAYGALTINGAGAVNGDTDATNVRINGAGTVNGHLTAQSVVVNGAGTFNGQIQSNEMTINGDASVRDGAGIGRLVIKGNASVGGGIAAHEIDVRGFIKSGGDVEAESFKAEGGFTIAGLLNAGFVDIKVFGACSAREIGGEKITIRQPAGFQSITQLLTFFSEKRLMAETIEGDDIFLEATTAKVVRGRNVSIGADCRIDLVEYTENYSRIDGATVSEARKVAPSA